MMFYICIVNVGICARHVCAMWVIWVRYVKRHVHLMCQACVEHIYFTYNAFLYHILIHMNTKFNTIGYIRNIYRCTCGHTWINTSLGKRRRMSCAYRHISNRMLICVLHMFCLCMCLCWLVLPYVLIICFYMCQHMHKILFSQKFAILRSYTYVYTYTNT